MADGIWVASGPGVPCGARRLGDAGDGRVWVDVCIMGQHLPQMYQSAELHDLAAEDCARLALCPACLGWGDTSGTLPADLAEAARGIDEVREPCAECGGSGRPALRITVTRDGAGIQGTITPLPHKYVPPLEGGDPVLAAAFGVPADMCLACSMPQDGAGLLGEALHHG